MNMEHHLMEKQILGLQAQLEVENRVKNKTGEHLEKLAEQAHLVEQLLEKGNVMSKQELQWVPDADFVCWIELTEPKDVEQTHNYFRQFVIFIAVFNYVSKNVSPGFTSFISLVTNLPTPSFSPTGRAP